MEWLVAWGDRFFSWSFESCVLQKNRWLIRIDTDCIYAVYAYQNSDPLSSYFLGQQIMHPSSILNHHPAWKNHLRRDHGSATEANTAVAIALVQSQVFQLVMVLGANCVPLGIWGIRQKKKGLNKNRLSSWHHPFSDASASLFHGGYFLSTQDDRIHTCDRSTLGLHVQLTRFDSDYPPEN